MSKSPLVLLVLMIGVGAVPERTTMPQSTMTTSATTTEADPVTLKPLPTDLLRELLKINTEMKNKIGPLFDPGTSEEDMREKLVEINKPLFDNEADLKALLGEDDMKLDEKQKARVTRMMKNRIGRVISRVKSLRSNSQNKAVVDTMDFLLADGQIPEFLKIMEKMLGNVEGTAMPQSTKSTSTSATSAGVDSVTMKALSKEEKDLLRELLKINTDMKNKIGPLYEGTSDENEELKKKLGKINSPLLNNEFYLEALLGEIKEDVDVSSELQKARMPKRMEKGMGRLVKRVKALKKNNADNKAVVDTMDFLLADGQIPEFLKIMERIFG